MVTKMRNDFKVYEEKDKRGDPIWAIRTGGRKGDLSTYCRTIQEADETARQLNLDPWFLERGDTRAERNA